MSDAFGEWTVAAVRDEIGCAVDVIQHSIELELLARPIERITCNLQGELRISSCRELPIVLSVGGSVAGESQMAHNAAVDGRRRCVLRVIVSLRVGSQRRSKEIGF